MSDLEKRLNQIEKKMDAVAHAPSPHYGGGIQQNRSDEIDLRELWNVLWQGKWWIIGITFLFAVAGVFYALYLPNMYKSEVLLSPVENDAESSFSSQLGGLAALTGINIGSRGEKTKLAMEIIKSREFISLFIRNRDLFVPLFAAKGWDRKTKKLVINEDIYDEANDEWVRDASFPFKPKPSDQEAYIRFHELLDLELNEDTGLLILSFEFFDPYLAQKIVADLVKEINLEVKSRDVADAQMNLKYLESQLVKTAISDMKLIFYRLIEEQQKTIMFAEVRQEYVFKVVDRPIVPELKSRPRRALICVLWFFIGGFFATTSVLFKYFLSCKGKL